MRYCVAKELHERFEHITTSTNYLLATALDVRFKLNLFINVLERENTNTVATAMNFYSNEKDILHHDNP